MLTLVDQTRVTEEEQLLMEAQRAHTAKELYRALMAVIKRDSNVGETITAVFEGQIEGVWITGS